MSSDLSVPASSVSSSPHGLSESSAEPSTNSSPNVPRPLRPSSGSSNRGSLNSPNPYSQSHSNAVSYPRPGSRGDPRQDRPWVFLGGSCDPTTWRKDIAVPKLTKHKIPFFNPQIDDWSPELIQLEAKAKEECEILLFVIDSKTRAIASMLEATEYILSDRKVVVVILNIPEGTVIDGEVVGNRQLKDLNRGRAFLCDVAARHQKHCDLFDNVEQAVNHIIYTHPNMSPRMNPSPSAKTPTTK